MFVQNLQQMEEIKYIHSFMSGLFGECIVIVGDGGTPSVGRG